jgi:hypothetical protein
MIRTSRTLKKNWQSSWRLTGDRRPCTVGVCVGGVGGAPLSVFPCGVSWGIVTARRLTRLRVRRLPMSGVASTAIRVTG